MHRHTLRVLLSLGLTIGLAGAFPACGSSSNGGSGGSPEGGADTSSGGSSGSSGGSGSSSGGSSSGGSSGSSSSSGGGDGGHDASDGGSTCASLDSAICDQLATCNPTGLKIAYGDVATCKAQLAQSCAATPPPGETGQNDAVACLAALTSSCDSFFETLAHTPTACLPKAGTVADGAMCGYDAQCVAGDDCNLMNASDPRPSCMKGTCTAAVASGMSCTASTDCDTKSGEQCVPTFVAGMPPSSDGNDVCQTVTYGGSGAQCVVPSNQQCQDAFYCSPNNTCAPKIALNGVCDPTASGCDDRIGLQCLVPSGGTQAVCTAPAVVPSGAQCGNVGGTNQICYGNLYCDTTTMPSTCKARVAQGGGCVSAVAGECDFGLVCAGPTDPNPGTCQPPVVQPCQ